MTEQQKSIDYSRLEFKGSRVLQEWKASREAERNSVQNSTTVYRTTGSSATNLLAGPIASSGFAVNEQTSMRVSAVYACTRLISGAIAGLPLPIYERTEDGRKRVENNPLWFLLNEQPYPTFTAASAWEYMAKCSLLNGDAFKQILRDRLGNITGLKPLVPRTVDVETVAGRLRYYVQPSDGKPYGLDQDDMLHFPGYGFDGERSMSVIQYSAYQSIGIALAADNLSGKFYANGASPKHLFETEKAMSADKIDELRKIYDEKYAGPANAGRPMVLTEGMTVKDLSINPADAELLESRKYQVIDIARAFGVPPHMIGAQDTTSSWGTGLEQMVLAFIKFSLQPHLVRYQQELNRKLFRTSKYFVEFNLDGLMKGDSKAEGDYLRQMLGGSQGPGWATTNEVRRIKNLPPIEGGDTVYVPKGSSNEKTTAPVNS